MSAGKGDTYRKVNSKVYGENYDAIFRKPVDNIESTWYRCPVHPDVPMNYRHPCTRCHPPGYAGRDEIGGSDF